MDSDIFGAILTKLNGDATLTGLLGSTGRCFRARRIKPADLPCVTISANAESSTPRVGYIAYDKVRDNATLIQVDIWVSSEDEDAPCTGEDADEIEMRIDALLLDASSAVAGTREGTWAKSTASQTFEEDTRIWHNAIRYGFEYIIND